MFLFRTLSYVLQYNGSVFVCSLLDNDHQAVCMLVCLAYYPMPAVAVAWDRVTSGVCMCVSVWVGLNVCVSML